MYVKTKYINAIHASIDFIEANIDGADDDNQEQETLDILRELIKSMENSKHKNLVSYYVRKKTTKTNRVN